MDLPVSRPRSLQLCNVCQDIEKLIPMDLPTEEDDAIPHQPSLVALIASANQCPLCFHIAWAIAFLYGQDSGWAMYHPHEPRTGIAFKISGSVFLPSASPGYSSRATKNQAVEIDPSGTVEPDFSSPNGIQPIYLVKDPYAFRPYLFGSWWQSSEGDQQQSPVLIGLGVRLAKSPSLIDAIGNTSTECRLLGTFLRFRVTHDSSLANIIPGRVRNYYLSSPSAFVQVKEWLQTCNQLHHCIIPEKTARSFMPTRILSVEHAKSGKIFLRETKGIHARYAALSHRWGQSHRLVLRRNNMHALEAGIDIRQVPKTFRDAIAICEELQIAYLWVDSLCIIQDDQADWATEAASMGSVYQNCYVTIAALHSADDSEGCFPDRGGTSPKFASPDTTCTGKPAFKNSVPFFLDTKNGPTLLFQGAHSQLQTLWDSKCYITSFEWMPSSTPAKRQVYRLDKFGANFDPIDSEPLSKRGWVLQERLLSPRTLYYSQGQMYWECQDSVLAEDGSRLKRIFPRVQEILHTKDGPAVWLRLIEQYSHRELTKASDKLFALAGLARIIAQASGDQYCAGLWKSNLLQSLCWSRKISIPTHMCSDEAHQHALPAPTASTFAFPAIYRAPSWSWAAVDGELEFDNSVIGDTVIAEVLDVSVVTASNQPYAQFTSGSLKLQAHVAELRLSQFQEHEGKPQFGVSGTLHKMTSLPVESPWTQPRRATEKARRLSSVLKKLSIKSNSPHATSSALGGDVTAVTKDLARDEVPTNDFPIGVQSGSDAIWNIVFDGQPDFPCRAALITDKFALILKAKENALDTFTRIGVARCPGGVKIEELPEQSTIRIV